MLAILAFVGLSFVLLLRGSLRLAIAADVLLAVLLWSLGGRVFWWAFGLIVIVYGLTSILVRLGRNVEG